jgi:hypothetical protein
VSAESVKVPIWLSTKGTQLVRRLEYLGFVFRVGDPRAATDFSGVLAVNGEKLIEVWVFRDIDPSTLNRPGHALEVGTVEGILQKAVEYAEGRL